MLKLYNIKTIKAEEFLRRKSKNHIALLGSDYQVENLKKYKTRKTKQVYIRSYNFVKFCQFVF